MPSVNGFQNVSAAETDIGLVDGEHGIMVYRGYFAGDLAAHHSFEEVAHLLWFNRLPTKSETDQLRDQFCKLRVLPENLIPFLDHIPSELDMMSFLRTAISGLGADSVWPPTAEQAMRFTALAPTLIAYRHARQQGKPFIAPHENLAHVANYLYMLHDGVVPSPDHVRALEAYFVLTMEHGMNASTFTGRVVTSTQSDMASALAAAIGAMKGPLHGGAPSEVMTMLEEIAVRDRAEAWLRTELAAGKRLMGFGHRIYKTRDPRALALRLVVEKMDTPDPWFDLSVYVEDLAVQLLEEYKPGRRLYANVEYWAASILRTVRIDKTLYTPTFSASRFVGWTTHMIEQAANNRLIRPQSTYVGSMPETRL